MQPQTRQIATAFERLALFWRASQWLAAKDHGLNPSQGEICDATHNARLMVGDFSRDVADGLVQVLGPVVLVVDEICPRTTRY